jgi:hypothetical protein
MQKHETDKPDTYYRDASIEAFQATIEEAREKGKTLDEMRFLLRRSYPFGAHRKGRVYKIWLKELHKAEESVGLAPKKHKSKSEESEKVEKPKAKRKSKRAARVAASSAFHSPV